MRRRLFLLAVAVVAAATAGIGSATTAPAERLTIPYLSGGAGVYLDGDGRPITSEGAPRVPGIHVRPPVTPPVPKPQPVPAPVPGRSRSRRRQPPVPPIPEPIPIPAPPPEGYHRPELVAAVAVPQVKTVFCRTDAAWPQDTPQLASATGYWRWGGSEITMRTWRCEGIAQEKIGTEAFARGLFVLAHEAAHAIGLGDECDADKRALATMGEISARLGWGLRGRRCSGPAAERAAASEPAARPVLHRPACPSGLRARPRPVEIGSRAS